MEPTQSQSVVTTPPKNNFKIFLAIFSLVVAGALAYIVLQLQSLRESVQATNARADQLVASSTSNGESLQSLYSILSNVITEEEKKNTVLQEQLGNVSQTVGKLDKLSKSDPQLLKKYSKVYFLNENYSPAHLADIPSEYSLTKGVVYQIHGSVSPFLEALLKAAKIDGVDVRIASAYRSFETQAQIKSVNAVKFGTTKANTFSADQGYSEHQLGTTVDFGTVKSGAAFGKFADQPEYKWMTEHAYKYGFIMSYPKNNAYYIYEPWHWRFVGVALATRLHNERKNFYDMDQKIIDEYLVDMFEAR